MHILLIHQYFLDDSGTGGSRFNELVRHWTNKGAKVTVIAGDLYGTGFGRKDAPPQKKLVLKEVDAEHLKVYRCKTSSGYGKSFAARLWAYFAFVFTSMICGLFYCRERYDLILVTSPPLFVGIAGVKLHWFKRIPLVFEVRDLWPESAIDMGIVTNKWIIKLSYWLEKWIYKRSKLINVLTPAFREALIKKGIPKEKIIMIPNACDFSMAHAIEAEGFDSQAFRKELGWTDDEFHMVYVGAHGHANHLIQVLEAARLVENPKLKFTLIGNGPQKPLLEAKKAEWQLDNLELWDPVPKKQVLQYILAADAGMSVLRKLKTFTTIYSNKTFDYMSCKKPVLLAIDGVSRELIETADCGIFIEPENPEDFAAKVDQYAQDKTRARKQGVNGYHYGLAHFDREELADAYFAHLSNLAKDLG